MFFYSLFSYGGDFLLIYEQKRIKILRNVSLSSSLILSLCKDSLRIILYAKFFENSYIYL